MVRKSHFSSEPAFSAASSMTPNALTKQEFGRRLAKLIRERNWTQSDAAREASLGRDAISNYVNGHNFPTPRSLEALAAAFDVSIEDLFPNAMMNALEDEHPAFELRVAAGHPGKAWVRINRAMTFETATEIARLLNVEDGRAPREET